MGNIAEKESCYTRRVVWSCEKVTGNAEHVDFGAQCDCSESRRNNASDLEELGENRRVEARGSTQEESLTMEKGYGCNGVWRIDSSESTEVAPA